MSAGAILLGILAVALVYGLAYWHGLNSQRGLAERLQKTLELAVWDTLALVEHLDENERTIAKSAILTLQKQIVLRGRDG